MQDLLPYKDFGAVELIASTCLLWRGCSWDGPGWAL